MRWNRWLPEKQRDKDGKGEALTILESKDERGYWEIAILNYGAKNPNSKYGNGNFSTKGDSGAAVFNAEGKLVALLLSGIGIPSSRGLSNHITFGTPGHYVYEVVREQYPDADFSRLKYDEVENADEA